MKMNDTIRQVSKGAHDFLALEQKNKLVAEYIWIGGTGLDIRAKARVLSLSQISTLSQIPEWNFDGSSTKQASGEDSEIWLRPRAFYPDPFRLGKNILVLCETLKPDGTPANSSFREDAKLIFEQCKGESPWFGLEQEYTLLNTSSYPSWPLGFPKGGFPQEQGPYYCSVGAQWAVGRQVMEAHLRCCLHCELEISGTNAEVMPGQWEYQIGPVEGIKAGDELWLSRYLLMRVSEHYGVGVTFDCKPVEKWNGAGMHTNFSTNSTRGDNGLEVIHSYISKLAAKHKDIIDVSGAGNCKRLSGKYETSDLRTFSSGVADRGASVRIPRLTERDGKGYFEDRRPASNCDPYVVTSILADIAINRGENIQKLHDRYLEFVSTLED